MQYCRGWEDRAGRYHECRADHGWPAESDLYEYDEDEWDEDGWQCEVCQEKECKGLFLIIS